MHKFCLGIIGRCLSCQPWIKISDLYHRQLKVMLEKQDNINFSVSIAGNSELEPSKRLEILYKKKPLNAVLYNIRLIKPQPILFSHIDTFGKYTYSLNPNLKKYFFADDKMCCNGESDIFPQMIKWRKKKDTHDVFDIPKKINKKNQRKLLGIPLNYLNYLAGKACGLNNLSIINELSNFKKLYDYCMKLKIPLFVLGPIPEIENYKIKENILMYDKLQKAFQKKLSEYTLPYYFLYSLHDEMGRSLYKNDNQHLTSEGHSFLAKELYPIFSLWIKEIIKS